MNETFDAKQEKLCHKNLAATVLNLMGNAERGRESPVGVEYITTFIFMIYDPSEFCEPQFPGQAHGVFPTLSQRLLHLFLPLFRIPPLPLFLPLRNGRCINQASNISRQTANQSQQQISPAQITLIEPKGKYPPYLHLSRSANYWPNYAKPGQRTCWHCNDPKR